MHDISRAFPTDDEQKELIDELSHDSDRAAALVAAAYLDKTLMNNLVARLTHAPGLHEEWFHSEGAIFGSFSQRIRAARALAAIGPVAQAHLDIVRRVRNQFAHALLPLKFTHPAIKAESEKLPDPHNENTTIWLNMEPTRRRFLALCLVLAVALQKQASGDIAARQGGVFMFPVGLP